MSRIKLGMAFAGGGVRGSSHLGIVQALHEHRIYPEIYAGTSAGSIVASLLAYGYEPEKALKKFLEANQHLVDVAYCHILKGTFTSSYVEGFVSGDHLESVLDDMFDGCQLGSIPVPLGIVSTDIDRGKQVIFTNSINGFDVNRINDTSPTLALCQNKSEYRLSDIIRASSGLPPVLVPKRIHGMKLVDGGITNNLPSDVAWALGADKVISLDLGYSGQVETKGFIDISHMCVNLLMKRVTDGNREDFGLYMNPKIYDVTALETDRIEECFERGYVYGKHNIDKVIKMLEEE
jgi:NTE family protein